MRIGQAVVALLATLALSASATLAGSPVAAKSQVPASVQAPPVRPATLTSAQFQTLRKLEAAPENSKVLQSSATYAPPEKGVRWTRVSDDVWTVIYDVGWPGTYLAVALCAL